MQLSLLQWARFYKSVNDMMPADKPENHIIEDDEALDRWFDNYVRETARKHGKPVESGWQTGADNIRTFGA